MAKKRQTRKAGRTGPQTNIGAVPPATMGTVTQVAEYVGASLADLMNRKDALTRQLADVNQQIAATGRRVTTAVAGKIPRLSGLGRGSASTAKKGASNARKGNRKKKRPLPPDEPMVAATERARSAEAKARAAQRARTSQRSGNR